MGTNDTFTNVDNSSDMANSLFTALTSEVSIPTVPNFNDPQFTITPDTTSDLYSDIQGATLEELTTNSLEGTGAFDVMMSAMDKHFEREFEKGRITANQYADAYASVTREVLSNATTFVLNKDQARWQAITAQMQARIAEIEATKALVDLEKAKIDATTAQFQMNLVAAQYALTKMQTATEEAQHDLATVNVSKAEYERNHILPAELALRHYERTEVQPSQVAINKVQAERILPAQAAIAEFENHKLQPVQLALQEIQRDRVAPTQASIEEFKLNDLMPIEKAQQQHILNIRMPAETDLIEEQIETQRANTMDTRSDGLTPVTGTVGLQKRNLSVDADIKDYNLANQLPRQVDLLGKQIVLTEEQGEAERAKTLDTRSDGSTVEGSVGKQKDLYDQQIDSFIKDAQHKVAKMYLDVWITQKTLDEGTNVPTEITNPNIGAVIQNTRNNNNL